MENPLKQIAYVFKLNDRLFLNSLKDISEEQAQERISAHNNPVIWIATHAVWARYNILMFLGKPVKNPFEGWFEDFRPYNENDVYPTVETVKKEWGKATALLNEALKSATAAQLSGESPIKSPISDFTNLGTVTFLAQHESYTIGQIAFLKKFITHEAMSYV